MEFRFNVNEIFKQPIVQVGHTLIPQGFKGDRRALWDTLSKVTDIVNAMGSASATAQGLTKPITSADRLRNSENQNLYLLIEPSAYNGKGAVTGLLKTGQKGLYVFDREGHHYHVQAPCILDFYVHESRQRTGFGKTLFEHMLQKETVHPEKLAIDRPSDKFLGFLKKHYSLVDPIKQMNNYVVYDGFFPNVKEMEVTNNNSNSPNKNMRGANGLQAQIVTSPYGRYGAPRPACSMGQIIHNQTSAVAAQEPTGLNIKPDEQPRCAPRVINKSPAAVVEPCTQSSGEPVTTSTVSATNISKVATVGNGLGDKSREPIIATGQTEQPPPQEPSLQYYWPFAKPAEEYPSIDKSQLHAKPCCDTIHELITNQCTHQQPPKPQKVPTDDIGIPIMQKKEHPQQRRHSSAGLNSTLHSSSKRLQTNSLLDDVGSYRTLVNSFSKEGQHYFHHPSLANVNQPYSYYKTAPAPAEASQSQTKVLSRRPSKLQAIPEQDGAQQTRSPSQQQLNHVERRPSSSAQQPHIPEEPQITEQPTRQSQQNIHQHYHSINQQNMNRQQQQENLYTDNANMNNQQQNTIINQQQHMMADGLQTNSMPGNMMNNQQYVMNSPQQMQGNLISNNQQVNMNNQQQPYANANNQQRVINYANYQQQPYYSNQMYYQPQQQMMPQQQQQQVMPQQQQQQVMPQQQQQYYNPYIQQQQYQQQQQPPLNTQQTAQQQPVEALQAQPVEQPLQEQPVLEGKPEEISESGQGERVVVNQKESKVKVNEPYKQEIGQGERRNELADFRQEEQITGTQEQTTMQQQQPDRIPPPANQQRGEIDENVAEKESSQPQAPQEIAPPTMLNQNPIMNQQYMMNQMQPAWMQQQQQQYTDFYGNQNVPQRMMLQGTTVQNQNYPRMQPCEPQQMINPQQMAAHQSEALQSDVKNAEETNKQANNAAEIQQQQQSPNIQQLDISQQQQYPSPQQNEHRQGLDHESLRGEPEKMKPPESVPYLEPIYPVTPSRTNQMSAKSSNSNRPRSFVGSSQHNIPNAMQRTSKVCQSEEAKGQKLTKENQHKRPQQSVNSLQRNITSALRKSQIGANFERQSKIFNALENDMTESKLRLISPKATGESHETPQQQPAQPQQQDEAKALEAPPIHPKLDRPQTLSLQTSTDEGMNNVKNDVRHDVEEVEETLKIEVVPKIVDELDKLHISREKEAAVDEHSSDTPQKKTTPSHLTDQGFFDLKFYHNKLW